MAKLENVTANLGATASRIRNDTAAKATTAVSGEAAAGSGDAAGGGAAGSEAVASPALQQQQQQQQQPGNATAGATGADGKPRGTGGSAAHEGVVRAAEAAVDRLVQAVGRDASPTAKAAGGGSSSGGASHGGKSAAEALEAVASTANETLTAVKQSKVALEAAEAEAATVGQTKDQVGPRRLPLL